MLEKVIESANGSSAVVAQAQQQAQVGRDDFLRMLVAQLEHQDPLNPQDGTEFTAQLAQFSSLEQLISMRSALDQLVAQLGASGGASGVGGVSSQLLAAGAIGKQVLARGSGFELPAPAEDGSRELPRLSFDLEGNATSVALVIHDAQGERARVDLGRRDQGRVDVPADLTPAQREALEQALALLPAGSYRYEVAARHGEQAVASQSYVGGRVTAASLEGEDPLLLLGRLPVPLSEVVEIREPGA
jgi:flagellar basal-body rod modification protein FlgD